MLHTVESVTFSWVKLIDRNILTQVCRVTNPTINDFTKYDTKISHVHLRFITYK